jgi:hypothetical protein
MPPHIKFRAWAKCAQSRLRSSRSGAVKRLVHPMDRAKRGTDNRCTGSDPLAGPSLFELSPADGGDVMVSIRCIATTIPR